VSAWACRSDLQGIGGYGLEGIFRDGEGKGVFAFSFSNSEFPFSEGDIIQGYPADLNRPEPEAVSQLNHGIGSDIGWSGKRECGK